MGRWVFIDGEVNLPKMFSASDIFLYPARICDKYVKHMLGSHYGCIPVVSNSGILNDTVIDIFDNIAEGNGRAGNKDYAHFLSIARGSLYETITQLELAKELGYVGGDSRSRSTMDAIYSLAEEISRMLTSMLKKYGVLEQKN